MRFTTTLIATSVLGAIYTLAAPTVRSREEYSSELVARSVSYVPSLVPRQHPPSEKANFFNAVAVVAKELDTRNVKYAIMGGSACFILGSPRATSDIDLVVGVASGDEVDFLDAKLKNAPGWVPGGIDEHGFGVTTPAIRVGSLTVPVEIFDPSSWPNRPQYKDVNAQGGRVASTLPKGQQVYTFTPAWLLREKISAIQERGQKGSKKFPTDLMDIQFLCGKIGHGDYQKGILDFTNQNESKAQLTALLARAEVPSAVKNLLRQVIKT